MISVPVASKGQQFLCHKSGYATSQVPVEGKGLPTGPALQARRVLIGTRHLWEF
jgi:hypothetical protein